VKEKAEAKTDYDKALKSGHSAFLVEEKLPDVFKVDNCHVEYIILLNISIIIFLHFE
jgi:hypothetical protein